jgi:hypothetical protein
MTRRSECGVDTAELRLRQTGVVIVKVDHAREIMSVIFSTEAVRHERDISNAGR